MSSSHLSASNFIAYSLFLVFPLISRNSTASLFLSPKYAKASVNSNLLLHVMFPYDISN